MAGKVQRKEKPPAEPPPAFLDDSSLSIQEVCAKMLAHPSGRKKLWRWVGGTLISGYASVLRVVIQLSQGQQVTEDEQSPLEDLKAELALLAQRGEGGSSDGVGPPEAGRPSS